MAKQPAGRPRQVRADARRNREQLVAAAAEVFADNGPGASLDAIAQHAGLGSGTLYRHFPTRDALQRAVYWQRVESLCERGRSLADSADPVDALVQWLRLLVELSSRHGLGAALLDGLATASPSFVDECRREFEDAGRPLLERAKGAHRVRPDVTLTDLHTLVHVVAVASAHAEDPAHQADRLFSLILDGVRRDPPPGR